LAIADKRKICIIAGVDMAHIGRQFGDKELLTPDVMHGIELRDRIYLECLLQQDKDALFDHIAEDEDARRICGFPTMYTVLDVFDRLGQRYTPQLFEYRQAVDERRECGVTFAGMGFYASDSVANSLYTKA
jgi:predicted class III extradiol MEMO1 family dioxygenase